MQQDYEKLFQNPFKHLDKVNSGGCGKVALVMSNQLQIRGVAHEVVVKDRRCDPEEFKENFGNGDMYTAYDNIGNKRVNGDCSDYFPLSHVLIKIGEDYYDSTGKADPDKWGDYTSTIDKRTLGMLCSRKEFWNSTFVNHNYTEDTTLESLETKVESTFKKWWVQ